MGCICSKASGPTIPRMDSYTLKLETYFRMAKGMSPLHTCERSMETFPYIEHIEERFILDHLSREFNVDLNQNLNLEEKATATTLRIMTEEYLFTTILWELYLWTDKERAKKLLDMSGLHFWYCRLYNWVVLWIRGYSREKMYQQAEELLAAIAAALDKKPYLFGSEPSEVDCAMMGVLGYVKWNMEGSFHYNLIEEKFPFISQYLDRMKTNYFPDWDQVIASGTVRNHSVKTQCTCSTLVLLAFAWGLANYVLLVKLLRSRIVVPPRAQIPASRLGFDWLFRKIEHALGSVHTGV